MLIDGKQAKLSTRVGKGSAVYLAAVLEVRDGKRVHAVMVLLTRLEIFVGWDGTPPYPVKDSVACSVNPWRLQSDVILALRTRTHWSVAKDVIYELGIV